ncbi:MAG TPA: GNAT family N-acetyltransferase [Candidatus Limnocylindrales bacterium]|nr:GNAT family N-acetyltransferase [Candidatus Limnocylindrales bacterium]
MTATSQPTIRPMRPADVEPATAAILRADWGDRRTWFEFATTQPECRPVVAELDGAIVGTGVGTLNGRVGWVGTIWVEPAVRGAGLGRALTQAVIDDLEAAGCRSLVLVATDQGLPLYERMGFELQTRYRILEAPGLDPAGSAADPAVRAFEARDLEAILELDLNATGEDRGHAIRRFAAPGTTKVLESDGEVRAFVIRAPWGGGATIAPDPAHAMRILEARRLAAGPGGRVRVGLVEDNAAGLAHLEAAGLAPIWSAPRLARGEPMEWRPEWIWGQFNHAIG